MRCKHMKVCCKTLRLIVPESLRCFCCPDAGPGETAAFLYRAQCTWHMLGSVCFVVKPLSDHGHGACRQYLPSFFTSSSELQAAAP